MKKVYIVLYSLHHTFFRWILIPPLPIFLSPLVRGLIQTASPSTFLAWNPPTPQLPSTPHEVSWRRSYENRLRPLRDTRSLGGIAGLCSVLRWIQKCSGHRDTRWGTSLVSPGPFPACQYCTLKKLEVGLGMKLASDCVCVCFECMWVWIGQNSA